MQLELQHVDPHADPHDVIVAQLRDLAPRLSEVNVTPSTPPQPAALPQPASEPPIHAAPSNDNAGEIRHPAPRRGLARGVAGLIVCAGIAAAAAWHSYGDEAKQRLSHLVPQLLANTPASAQSANAAEPHDTTAQASQPAADPTPTQDTAAAAPATEPSSPAEAAPAPAALSPELTQSIVTMAREVAALKQTVEQLQASQQQLSRDVAKVAEHEARRKSAAQASKPAPPSQPQRTSTQAPVTRSVQPASAQAYPQGPTYPQTAAQREAYISPPAPMQLPPQPGDTNVPRPPMPLR
ncbi:MAG TPA: hypothetical protein VF499_08935 [Afipia sp.]